jgi:hypothetical protein
MRIIFPARSISRWIVLACFAATIGLWLVSPSRAFAAEVHFDPDSPASKEYALPLPQARSEALGDSGVTSGSPSSAPLFGVGISGGGRGGGGDDGAAPVKGNSGGHGVFAAGDRTSRTGKPVGAGQDNGARPQHLDGRSRYSAGTAIAWIVGVLVVGLLFGVLLRAAPRFGGRRIADRA